LAKKVAILIVLLREAQGLNEQYEKILLPIDLHVRFDKYGNMRDKGKVLGSDISKKSPDTNKMPHTPNTGRTQSPDTVVNSNDHKDGEGGSGGKSRGDDDDEIYDDNDDNEEDMIDMNNYYKSMNNFEKNNKNDYSMKPVNVDNSFYRITDGRNTGILYGNDYPPIAKLDMYPNSRYLYVYVYIYIYMYICACTYEKNLLVSMLI
jgi:hypothetical protein